MSKLVLHLAPHQGVGPIVLGGSRGEARSALHALGFPLEHSRADLDYFCDSSIQVESSSDGFVWFIGFSASHRFSLHYHGQDVFACSAQNLFALLSASDASGKHTFRPDEYTFPNQIITLWDADEQYDRLGGESKPVWGQVGIGNTAFAAAIAAISGKG